MSDIALRVENLSKLYRLGEVGTGTLSHDLNRWWYKVRGKEDPYLKIGQANDRTSKSDAEYVWALKDVNFEVKKGEVLGIIGKNGAGKSTLLKILSQVTSPTKGKVEAFGRIASLLEVGTGFHPELTGRENIFLNGAILGMRKWEIAKKFDEIVDFAGVEAYIDTPVKRYSSGMYVRLAFAVAAFLEPDILVVDEVLAVGDIEFQKKCLGRMEKVSQDFGRTIFFVSHNLAAIKTICKSGICLVDGKASSIQSIDDSISKYSSISIKKSFPYEKDFILVNRFNIISKESNLSCVEAFSPFTISLSFINNSEYRGPGEVEIYFKDQLGIVLTSISTWVNSEKIQIEYDNNLEIKVPFGVTLSEGTYTLDLRFRLFKKILFENVCTLQVLNSPISGSKKQFDRNKYGIVYTPSTWDLSILGTI
jgi:lipopolysaccharide transport system ATP-binding protein